MSIISDYRRGVNEICGLFGILRNFECKSYIDNLSAPKLR